MQHRSRGPFWCECGTELCDIGVRTHFGVTVGRNYATSVSGPISV